MRSLVYLLTKVSLLTCLLGSLVVAKTCDLSPLGHGRDDTEQILRAIDECGSGGRITLNEGNFNITKKMTWNLHNSQVDLFGKLNFVPDIQSWLESNNTFRVVFIQSQASWFVVSGSDFVVDAHGIGGIEGNGQPWWEYFQEPSHPREDGDGRPLSLTVFNATRGTIRDFTINSPPFWCNAIAESVDVTYDGMKCNATNTNASFFGQNIVPNTDGIDTYRSDRISLLNFDITSGDDCLAIKGNSTNVLARNITCRGGNGIAFGSLGQYVQFNDIVENIVLEDLQMIRLNASIQPNMVSGVYFKTWTGTVNGVPPTGGGGGGGFVKNVTSRRVSLDRVDRPVHVYQTNGGSSTDTPSSLQFSDLAFADWEGTADTTELVDIECSPAVPCPNISFSNFGVTTPSNAPPKLICKNVVSVSGLSAPCNSTGKA